MLTTESDDNALNYSISADSIEESRCTSTAETGIDAVVTSGDCSCNLHPLHISYEKNADFLDGLNLTAPKCSANILDYTLTALTDDPHNPNAEATNEYADKAPGSSRNSGHLPVQLCRNLSTASNKLDDSETYWPFHIDRSLSERSWSTNMDNHAHLSMTNSCTSGSPEPIFFHPGCDGPVIAAFSPTLSRSRSHSTTCTESSTPASSHSSDSRHRKEIPEPEWRRIRPHLYQLYFMECRSLRSVMQTLVDDHDFRAR